MPLSLLVLKLQINTLIYQICVLIYQVFCTPLLVYLVGDGSVLGTMLVIQVVSGGSPTDRPCMQDVCTVVFKS